MQARTKRFVLNASSVCGLIGLIITTLLTVFGIVFLWIEGQFLFSGMGVVLLYAMFMGSDFVYRHYLRPNMA